MMPQLFIHTVSSTLACRDDGADYARPEDAMAVGVKSAIEIIEDEIVQEGRTSTAVEVCIEQEDGTVALRTVVAISVTPLLTGPVHDPV